MQYIRVNRKAKLYNTPTVKMSPVHPTRQIERSELDKLIDSSRNDSDIIPPTLRSK